MSYVAPSTIEEARASLASAAGARVFAGATDLLPQARAGRPLPGTLVDLKRIPGLVGVRHDGDDWVIGAATSAAVVAAHPGLRAAFPGLTEGVGLIGSDQVQNRATIGGNLGNASPAADSGPPMVVNDAVAVVATDSGARSLPVADLMAGPGRTTLGPAEFVVEFRIADPGPRRADAYLRLTPRTEMDIAVVGAAARVTLDEAGRCTDAAVVLGAVAPTVVAVDGIVDVLGGGTLDDEALERAADLARAACRPIDDKRGTKDYRVHIAGVLTRRALLVAATRAGGAV